MLSVPHQSSPSRQLFCNQKALTSPCDSLKTRCLCCLQKRIKKDSRSLKTQVRSFINPERPRILQQAVSDGRLQQISLLLNAGINANSKDSDTGQTALIRTTFLENAKVRKKAARMLLKYGAKVKKADQTGRSALSWACLTGREDLVKLFLSRPEYEADLGSADEEGNTNLMLACMSGNSTVVRVIAEAFKRNNFDINKRNIYGEKALTLAYSRKFYDCAQILSRDGKACSAFPHLKAVESSARPNSIIRLDPNPTEPLLSQREKTCNLPKLFNLYAVQLTNSYPKKQLRRSIPVLTFDTY